MNRRHLLAGATASLIVPPRREALADDPVVDVVIEGDLPPLPDDLAKLADSGPAPYVATAPVGTGKPQDDEIARAYKILLDSPYDTSHVDVAMYFLGLSGRDAVYRREWPQRANPVIFHMFSATDTKPSGDITPWCAASLNWFILRGKAKTRDEIGKSPGHFSQSGVPFSDENILKYSTHSASSGSFRCWSQVTSPKIGDIAVLADHGTEDSSKDCGGTGHVAIYLKNVDETWAEVIGGNQAQRGSNGAITKAKVFLGSGGRFLYYVSPKVA